MTTQLQISAPAARPRALLLVLLLACASGASHGHRIWFEQPGRGPALIRFGEFDENLREASPGLLDTFRSPPVATWFGQQGRRQVEVVKGADAFGLPLRAGSGESLVAQDEGYPIFAWPRSSGKQRTWYYPAARLITGWDALAPRLPLDLLPTGRAGEFRVVFQGLPLPRATVTLAVASGWRRQARTDAQGLVRFDMPWRGLYVAKVSHEVRQPGRRSAQASDAYDLVHYATTLSYYALQGLAAVPAGPAARPHEMPKGMQWR